MRSRAELATLVAAVVLAACAQDQPDREPEPATAIPDAPADVVEDAVWSHDGSRLAVAWTRRDRTRVYGLFAPYDSTPPEPSRGIPLTEGQGSSPAWSPDGLWLAFATIRDGNSEIYRVRPDGTGPENLTRDPAADAEPSYAPDGRHIAFVTDRGGNGPRVWIMDRDGGGARALGDEPPGEEHDPAWSRDGGTLAFSAGEGARRAVWTATADGSAARRVAKGGAPAWSSDGRTLYYERSDSIFARAQPGADAPELFLAEGRRPHPSPDGRWLAFVRGDGSAASLWLLDMERDMESRITP